MALNALKGTFYVSICDAIKTGGAEGEALLEGMSAQMKAEMFKKMLDQAVGWCSGQGRSRLLPGTGTATAARALVDASVRQSDTPREREVIVIF